MNGGCVLAGGALFGGLDRDALAAIGIDAGAVRAKIEASFGPGALIHVGQAAPRGPRLAAANPAVYPALDGRGFLPHGPGAVPSRGNGLREAQARHDTQFSTEHLALGLLAVDEGLVPPILPALGCQHRRCTPRS